MTRRSSPRVVITGIGAVTPLAANAEMTWNRLLRGQSGVVKLPIPDRLSGVDKYDAIAGVVPSIESDKEGGLDASKYLSPRDLQKANRYTLLALCAADEALRQAGWIDLQDAQLERTAIVLGSGIGGGGSLLEASYAYAEKGMATISAYSIPLSLMNIAAGFIAIKYGFKGPIGTPGSACAASLQSIGDGFRLLQSGEADVVLAGGSEACLDPVVFGGFTATGALTKGRDEPPECASKPFDKQRDGFVLSEGAAMVIMETLDHARARGATPLVEVVGYATTSDAYHITSGPADGNGVRRAMQQALRHAELDAADIGFLSAHATSTKVGDSREALAIADVFGKTGRLPVSAVKGALGHTQGSAGAVATTVTVQAMGAGIFPHTLNTHLIDESADGLDVIVGEPRKMAVEFAMINSFGFGGVNASLVLQRVG